MSIYKPIEIVSYDLYPETFYWAMRAMRLPTGSIGDTLYEGKKTVIGESDLKLASRLVKNGDDHAKAMRGIIMHLEIKFQVGWILEFETYRAGVECMSTSSSMHQELSGLSGELLAVRKQEDLPTKVYTRILTISYQVLRSMHRARRPHRHPDWQIFCDWIETLQYAKELITISTRQEDIIAKQRNQIHLLKSGIQDFIAAYEQGGFELLKYNEKFKNILKQIQ